VLFLFCNRMADATPASTDALPNDVGQLKDLIRELVASHQAERQRNTELQDRIDLLLRRLYGVKSDKLALNQPGLFDGLEGNQQPANPPPPPPPAPEPASQPSPKGSHGRKAIPDDLNRVAEIIDFKPSEMALLGGEWKRIGEEVTEKLDYKPSQLFVRRLERFKYRVRFPDGREEIHVPGLPPEALPRAKAGNGLLADVVVSKLVDHLPLYRQVNRHARQGVHLSRSTLCDWLMDTADVLRPLYLLLKKRVLSDSVVFTDDTPVRVQESESCRLGRLWAYRSRLGTVYDSTPDRCRDGPVRFLSGFEGYLQCDAYAGYNEVFARAKGKVTQVGCWAHVRRKFVEAENSALLESHAAVARIKALYQIEERIRGEDAQAKVAARTQEALPLLQQMKDWLELLKRKSLPKCRLMEAVNYALNQWDALMVYTTNGGCAIDNNTAERAVKPFAIGRKNWLFFGSDRGGRALEILASFTETCKQFDINSWQYLKDTLDRLPVTTPESLHSLLPACPPIPQLA